MHRDGRKVIFVDWKSQALARRLGQFGTAGRAEKPATQLHDANYRQGKFA